MTPALKQRTCTHEEYLELEVASEERHEYVNGEIRLIIGGTPDHNDIAGNLYILVKLALRGKPYRTFYTDQRLWIPGGTAHPEGTVYTQVLLIPSSPRSPPPKSPILGDFEPEKGSKFKILLRVKVP